MLEAILPAVLTTGLVGLTAAVVLVVVSKLFVVEENPLVEQVNELLPGANCGGCGYAGCQGLAQALVETRDPDLGCPLCDKESTERIGELLGIELQSAGDVVAALRCHGSDAQVTRIARYDGIEDCHAAMLLYQGHLGCSYGCLGLGSCIRACPFGAIRSEPEGIVEVDEEICTGCGRCVDACPKDLLVMVPRQGRVFVACASMDKGGPTRKACKVGCFACRKCQKACPDGAILVKDNLARIDQEKCSRCQECVEVCPSGCILTWHLSETASEREEETA